MRKSLYFLSVMVFSIFASYKIVNAVSNYQRYTTMTGGQIYNLQDDGTQTQSGALKFGNDASTPTAPTTNGAGNFSIKVPIFNSSNTTMSQGTIVIAFSTTVSIANTFAYGTFGTFPATTTVIGVIDSSLAAQTTGYMVVGGYALVLTTGPVKAGDLIVSTFTASNSGGVGGYGAANNSASNGTVVGKAMNVGTTAGGLTPCIISLE